MRHKAWLFLSLISSLSATAALLDLPQQQPLASNAPDLYSRLNFSSQYPLIFHSTFSLLQQWPNTFFPAGFTIAPCTIPPNTNLYHAGPDDIFPPSPEWFAFDSAMAYAILGTLQNSHMLTYRTTKTVKCLYFDGTSAALQYDGSMESQMLFLHNNSANVPADPVFGNRPPRWPPGDSVTDPNRNETRWSPLGAEYDRAAGLCDFIKEKNLGGLGWGYEGIVRMNEGFELIWCNFSSPSAELVSWINVSAPGLVGMKPPWIPRRPPPRTGLDLMRYDTLMAYDRPRRNGTYFNFPGWDRPFREQASFEWFRTATNAYGFAGGTPGTGETRVKIDTCGLFSFYDPELQDQSQVWAIENRRQFNLSSEGHWQGPKNKSDSRTIALQELGRRRRFQYARNISETDGLYMRASVESRMRDTLSQTQESTCSGIDWLLTTQTIVTDYSAPLQDLQIVLSHTLTANLTNTTILRSHLTLIRGLNHQFLMPYYTYTPNYTNDTLHTAFSPTSPTSLAALARCKNQHTPPPTTPVTTSETLTLTSILSVLSALCTTLLPLFLSTEVLWLEHFNNVTAYADTIPSCLQTRAREAVTGQLDAVEELMAWLGWTDQWTGCEPGCAVGDVCAIPMWPVPMGAEGFWRPGERERELWKGGTCVGVEDLLGGGG